MRVTANRKLTQAKSDGPEVRLEVVSRYQISSSSTLSFTAWLSFCLQPVSSQRVAHVRLPD